MTTLPGKISFGDVTVDLSRRSVSRVGSELKFSTREFDTLAFLIENAGRTLSHDELIAHVWHGITVTNNSVEKIIASLRKALADNAADPRYIKTVHGRGYAFIGVIAEPLDDLPTSPEKTGWRLARLPRALRYGVLIAAIVMCLLPVAWKGRSIVTRLTSTHLISDEFSSNALNEQLWTVRGEKGTITDGVMHLRVEATDNGPRLFSKWLAFDRRKPITVQSRLRVARSHNLKDQVYFTGFFGLQPKTSIELEDYIIQKTMFGVAYTDYDYESRWSDGTIKEVEAEGFFLTRNGGAPHMKMDYQNGNISERIEPVWEQWFDQTIIYDPESGDMKLYINGEFREGFNAGPFTSDIGRDEMRIEINPRGWWLYHEIDIDYIDIYQ